MNSSGISRRKLLAGVAVTGLGGVAATTATGPTPMFTPVEPKSEAWATAGYNTQHTARNPSATVARSNPRQLWTVEAPGVRALVVADGTIFAGGDGGIVALDAATGTREWEAPTPSASLYIDGNRLFTVGRGGTVAALDAGSGERDWTRRLDVENGHSVLLGNERLYVGCTLRVVACDRKTGATQWQVDASGLGSVAMALTADRLIEFSPGQLAAFGPRTGTGAVVRSGPRTDWTADASIARSAPTVADGTVLTGSRDGQDPTQRLTAFDTATGDRRWQSDPLGELVTPPAVVGDIGVVGAGTWQSNDNDGLLCGLRLDDGNRLWTTTFPDPVTRPITDGETVVAGTYTNGKLYAVDAETGDRRWSLSVPGPIDPIAAVGDTLYVGTRAGTVTAVGR